MSVSFLSYFQNPVSSITLIVLWTFIIVASLIIESQTADLIAVWFGVGAIPALILAILEIAWPWQIVTFALISLVLVIITRPMVKKFNDKATIPTNADRLIGMIGKVTKEIPIGGKGEIIVNFQNWTAINKDNEVISVNTNVVIKEIEGNKVVVEKIEEIDVK